MKATRIRDIKGFLGARALFQLNPPLDGNDFVIVSQADSRLGSEVSFFAASEDGDTLSWSELRRVIGVKKLRTALSRIGYKEVKPPFRVKINSKAFEKVLRRRITGNVPSTTPYGGCP